MGLPPYVDANATGSINSAQYKAWFGTFNNNDANDRLVTGALDAVANRLNQGLRGTARLPDVSAAILHSSTPAPQQLQHAPRHPRRSSPVFTDKMRA